MNDPPDLVEIGSQVERDGFAIVDNVIDPKVVERLKCAIAELDEREEVRRRGGVFGVRNLLDVLPESRELAVSTVVRELVESLLGPEAFAVRGTLFDKIPSANWKLGWHQDSIITVREPRDVAGFGTMVQKAGVWHAEPPAQCLAGMLAVRIHLDDCGRDNGPLRVLPGSHRCGWIESSQEWRTRVAPVICTGSAGSAVLMRPLLLHASSSSEVPAHRRVVHLEYAAEDLPGGLEWHTRLSP